MGSCLVTSVVDGVGAWMGQTAWGLFLVARISHEDKPAHVPLHLIEDQGRMRAFEPSDRGRVQARAWGIPEAAELGTLRGPAGRRQYRCPAGELQYGSGRERSVC